MSNQYALHLPSGRMYWGILHKELTGWTSDPAAALEWGPGHHLTCRFLGAGPTQLPREVEDLHGRRGRLVGHHRRLDEATYEHEGTVIARLKRLRCETCGEMRG